MSRASGLLRLGEALAPLRSGQFRYQFGAQAVSVLGSTLSPVALTLGVLRSGLSASDLGLVLAANTVPLVVFVLIGGVVADRLPRHGVMVATNAVRAVTQTCLGLLLLEGRPDVWALVGIQAVTGAATAFYAPASTGLTATTVEKDLLQRANALMALVTSVGGSLGPLAAGAVVLTVGGGWALIADGATFLVGALLLTRLRIPPRARSAARQGLRASLAEGFSEVRRRTWVWSSILAFASSNFAIATLYVLGPALLLRHHGGTVGWAAVVAAMSVGQVLGNLMSLRLEPGRPVLAARLLELAQVPLMVCVCAGAGVAVLIPAAVVCGVGLSFPDTLWYSTLQRHLPEESISRIASYDWMGSLVLRPVGYAGAAAISAQVGLAGTLGGTAAFMVLTRVLGAALPDVRRLRTAAETAGPVPEPSKAPA
jgi:MFS family permease